MKRSLCSGLLLAVGTQLAPAFAQSARFSSLDQSLLFADQATTCPVTLRPEKAFVPPFPYLHRPPDPISFWYGDSALWTQVWAPPPWTPLKVQEKVRMYWASADK